MAKKGKGQGKRYRSAETGKFVSEKKAKANPRTTVGEKVKSKKKK